MKLQSFANGEWFTSESGFTPLFHAVNGSQIAEISSHGLDFRAMIDYSRKVGGYNLRKYTIHQRARMLKALAFHLMEKKELFYELSKATGASKIDSWIDIEGGIGTLFTYASKARREMPDEKFYVDGVQESLSKNNTFIGHHICVPLEGVAIHINAFNFPCWGMLEKMAPSIIAGMPVIIKPASLTAYLTELMVKEIIKSGILPEGSLQLVSGSLGDALDYLTCQDVVTFTGSAQTGRKLKTHPTIIENSVRFNMEADSLNFCMLGLSDAPGTPEFDLFIKEVIKEVTTKAGQKCTAIRRTIVPQQYLEDVIQALKVGLDKRVLGDPYQDGVKMGPLAGRVQVQDVLSAVANIRKEASLVYGDFDNFNVVGAEKEKGAFFPSMLLLCEKPLEYLSPHEVEAFGPVTTLLPYSNTEEAIEIVKLGKGSLVGSVFTADDDFGANIVYGTAAYHGRILVVNKQSGGENTGHGSPMPHLVHGGPGRAGGGEELGGIRSILHYMQRTAIQGSPTTLSKITKQYLIGADRTEDKIHPFTKYYDELNIGDTLTTHRRTVTETDIVNFTGISWDNFYAHTDTTSIEDSIFERRVAHGYFIISAAAGLFVNPKPGPVLANYGLDELRFVKPVYAGDTIYVKLTVKSKQEKEPRDGEKLQGVVKWLVEVFTVGTANTPDELCALATILTLVERKE
jgi:oxepin-CoA hydrolase/3-oxo-5,6-dehydrosuberyl-CoA semialdehyde dehydrogenase